VKIGDRVMYGDSFMGTIVGIEDEGWNIRFDKEHGFEEVMDGPYFDDELVLIQDGNDILKEIL